MYLRRDVVAVPVLDQWYAWVNLISPSTAAMYVANTHVKLMQSFVANPATHVAALKDPAMLGGPFIALPESRAPEVAQLLARTLERQKPKLELAEAIRTLDGTLAQADGGSLEPWYRTLPAPLKGLVELGYDAQHRARFRFLEPLLYASPVYDRGLQAVQLYPVASDERPFVFTTPQVWGPPEREKGVQLEIPFDDPRLERLFRARTRDADPQALAAELGLDAEQTRVFHTLFTPTPPAPPRPPPTEGVRVRYLGHASVLIETKDVTLLTDPVLGYQHGQGPARVSTTDLPERLDYVLLTHNHLDHIVLETLLPLRHRIGALVLPRSEGGSLLDPSLKRAFQAMGFANVIELDELERLPLPGGELVAVPFLGEHGDLEIRTKSTWFVKLDGQAVLTVADLNNVAPEVFTKVRALLGPVDTLFVGMECEGAPVSWTFGALFTKPLARKLDQTRRFSGSNAASAWSLVEAFSPKKVWVYAMGLEPWLTFLTALKYTEQSKPIVESNALVEKCRAAGLEAKRLDGLFEFTLG